ncbi:MAG: rod shape-determining protein [Alistipes sp.]|nr:rod shape-determining protein [Candidatus Alistipes equi]
MENYVSLDIGSHNIKMLYAKRQANGKVTILGEATQPTKNSVEEGLINNVLTLAEAIKQAKNEIETSCDIVIKNVTVGISGSHIECCSITDSIKTIDVSHCIQPLDVRNINTQMCSVEHSEDIEICSMYPLYYEIDNASASNKKRVLDVVGTYSNSLSATYLFTYCNKEQIDRVKSACKIAGVDVAKLVLLPEVTPYAYLKMEDSDECCAIVDLGKGTTNLSIIKDGRVHYIASIPIGIDAIDGDLLSHGIHKRYVEQLRKKYGRATTDNVNQESEINEYPAHKALSHFNVVTIIQNRLLDIIECVESEISRAHMMADVKNGDGIILTGGGSLIDGITNLFANKLGCQITDLDPKYVNVDEESLEILSKGTIGPALGIILSQINKCTNEVIDSKRPTNEESKPVEITIENKKKDEEDKKDELDNDLGDQIDDEYSDKPKKTGMFHNVYKAISQSFKKIITKDDSDELL